MRTLLVSFVGIAAGWATLVSAASNTDSPQQQMQKCAVCKAMAAKPELMKNMTWETHKIANGMLSVASVPKDQKPDFDAVHAQMLQNIEQVKADQQSGKSVELCDYCTSMSDLMKSGAKAGHRYYHRRYLPSYVQRSGGGAENPRGRRQGHCRAGRNAESAISLRPATD